MRRTWLAPLCACLVGLVACSGGSSTNDGDPVWGAAGAAGAAGMGPNAGSGGTGGSPPLGNDAATTMDAGSGDSGAAPDVPSTDGGMDAGDAQSNSTDSGTPGATCAPAAGGGIQVDATIVVGAGETFDGECQRYFAGPAVGDGGQSEDQDPVFKLEDGATLINVVVGAPAADGIHTHGDVTLMNITWDDIGEDALTIKESGTVVLDGGTAHDGEDKVFQINAASTFRLSNFRADSAGKLIRQNGGTDFQVDVYIDACDISNMDEAVFRTDSETSTVSMTNTRYSQIGDDGDELWYGVNPLNITVSGNTQY